MNDTRLSQVLALLDDARCLLIEVVDEGPAIPENNWHFNQIDAARQFINHAVIYTQLAQGEQQ